MRHALGLGALALLKGYGKAKALALLKGLASESLSVVSHVLSRHITELNVRPAKRGKRQAQNTECSGFQITLGVQCVRTRVRVVCREYHPRGGCRVWAPNLSGLMARGASVKSLETSATMVLLLFRLMAPRDTSWRAGFKV